MGDFRRDRGNRSNRGGGFGRRDGGGGRSGGWSSESRDRDRGPVSMHQATCAECGKTCEVPFRPTEGKPVYCDDCFSRRRSGGAGGSNFSQKKFDSNKSSFGGNRESSNNSNKQLDLLNEKMDKLINMMDRIISTNQAKPLAEKKEVIKIAKPTKDKKEVNIKKETKIKTINPKKERKEKKLVKKVAAKKKK